MEITPLDKWVFEKTRGDLPSYQLKKLKKTLKSAQSCTFYRDNNYPTDIESLEQLTSLPAMDAKTLISAGTGLVSVTQSEIARIVTLATSGTTGIPKRVYFTQDDQELTVDYFAHGLPTVVKPGGTMAILLPCERPGGVGDLIARALLQIPVTPIRFGLVGDLSRCANTLRLGGADSIVGIPVQVLSLARYCEAKRIKPDIRGVLLSTDNIPRVIIRELKRIWSCEVFEHYGMTETGLGGAIDCMAHNGYHIRENDLLFEILGEDGNPLPDGTEGELTFTTLTRRGMPLIRYRTGDFSKILPGRCACGSQLKRIAPVSGRRDGDIFAACGTVIKMSRFDEVLFAIPQLSDFTLSVSRQRNFLKIEADTQESFGDISEREIRTRLNESGLTDGLTTQINIKRHADFQVTHGAKRAVSLLPDTEV